MSKESFFVVFLIVVVVIGLVVVGSLQSWFGAELQQS